VPEIGPKKIRGFPERQAWAFTTSLGVFWGLDKGEASFPRVLFAEKGGGTFGMTDM